MKTVILTFFIVIGVDKMQNDTNVYRCISNLNTEYRAFTATKHVIGDTMWLPSK